MASKRSGTYHFYLNRQPFDCTLAVNFRTFQDLNNGCLNTADYKSALAPQLKGTQCLAPGRSESETFLRAGVFKAQVKCCRNELKQNPFQKNSSLKQLSCVWSMWPPTLAESKQAVREGAPVTKVNADIDMNDRQQLLLVSFATLKSDFNDFTNLIFSFLFKSE